LTATIALTAEQSRALIDAIATADTLEALADLRRVAREQLLDVRGGFLELLIELRQDTLTRTRANRGKIA
jgi:hypothetical protein